MYHVTVVVGSQTNPIREQFMQKIILFLCAISACTHLNGMLCDSPQISEIIDSYKRGDTQPIMSLQLDNEIRKKAIRTYRLMTGQSMYRRIIDFAVIQHNKTEDEK